MSSRVQETLERIRMEALEKAQRERPGDLTLAEERGDGRNVDLRIGTLSGEGSGQQVKHLDRYFPTIPGAAEEQGPASATPSYYGIPMLKEPVWIWSIPVYFYVGGLAGAASMLGFAADVAGRGGLHGLARKCHWVGAAGDAVSGALLVHDLGRPERFLNMMRVFRPTSPMSMGSWILVGSSAANGAAVLLGHRKGLLGALGSAAGAAGGVFGAGLAGYTAVLLTNTSVPLWQHMHRTLPFLFMSSAVATAGALFSLLPHTPREGRVVRAFTRAGLAGTLAAGVAVEREVSRSPEAARPLKRGPWGAAWRASQLCTAAALGLSLLPRRARWAHAASSVLATVGGLAMRFAISEAGKPSARDPQAAFRSQREGLGAAEVGPASQVLRQSQPDRFPLPVVR